jgi:hypothetical protein
MHLTSRAVRAGLGDQLQRYRLIFGLAHVLGRRYLHTRMAETRIFPRIGDFIGIDQYPDAFDETRDGGAAVDVRLSDLVDIANGVVVLPDGLAGKELLRVDPDVVTGPGEQILRSAARLAPPFPLAQLYRRAVSCRGPFPGTEDPARVVVHLRLGDTVLVPLPNGRCVYADGVKVVGPEEQRLARQQIDLVATRAILRRLRDAVDGRIVVLSDGFERTKRYLRGYRTPLGLTMPQFEDLCADFDARLDTLRTLDGIEFRIGEAEDDTRFAIDILANADFVVSSHGSFAATVARLLGDRTTAQLLSLFAVSENPALLDRISHRP